jgi:hypothetical protein
MIDYVLEMNHLTKEKPNDRYARIVNNPSELILVAPQMVKDEEVQLKITTQFSASRKLLKTAHSTTFNVIFTVVA